MDRHDVYAHQEELDEWERISYRDSLWTDDGRATGIVSSNTDFYNIIQYGDVLETVGQAVEQYGISVSGSVSISPTAHKLTAEIDFTDSTIYPREDDPVDLGLRIQTGHSGFHALKYDVGGVRQVCSNGMMGFVSDLHFEQTHNESFQPGLAYNAVDAVVESPETVENRLEEAQEQSLLNQDEALLVLMDLGINRYLEQPVPDLLNALYEEVDEPEAPTLYETYNAGTRALTHYSDAPGYELSQGFEQLSQLLETGYSELPEPRELGRDAVNRRSRELIENGETDPYWEDEEESLRELMEQHELKA